MFRTSLESLERREVFSGTDTLPVESMSLNVIGAAEVASAVLSGTYNVNVDPQLAADFDGDSGAAYAVGQVGGGFAADFNDDGAVDGNDLAARNPRQAVQTGVDTTSIGLNALARILPYVEQDNLYKLRSSLGDSVLDDTAHRTSDAAFAELGSRGILLDPEARGNIVDIVDGTSNTIMFAEARAGGSRSCVTDLILDPFNSVGVSGRRG